MLFKLYLRIGRLQHCPQCKKRMFNRGQSLSYDLYLESQAPKGVKVDKNLTWCKNCSEKERKR